MFITMIFDMVAKFVPHDQLLLSGGANQMTETDRILLGINGWMDGWITSVIVDTVAI